MLEIFPKLGIYPPFENVDPILLFFLPFCLTCKKKQLCVSLLSPIMFNGTSRQKLCDTTAAHPTTVFSTGISATAENCQKINDGQQEWSSFKIRDLVAHLDQKYWPKSYHYNLQKWTKYYCANCKFVIKWCKCFSIKVLTKIQGWDSYDTVNEWVQNSVLRYWQNFEGL